jgi:hypothetical protein
LNKVLSKATSLSLGATFEVLDPQDGLTPLGQLLRCVQAPEQASAVLVLRDSEDGTLLPVAIVRLTLIDHERIKGAVFFNGTLDDERHISGYVHATPQTEGSDVLGSATIRQ